MGWWQVSADTLAESRFVISPLAEATASLIVLERGTAAHPGERAWLDAHHAAYRERLAGDPVTALLVRAALGRHWIADLFTTAPTAEGEPALAEELARIRERPPEVARTDLTMSLGGPLPTSLHRSDLPERAADLLDWVWTETVLPYWPRRRRIMEADVVARTSQLSQGGWAAALATCARGCGGWERAACRSTRTVTRRERSPGLSCCSSRSPRARAGSRGTRRTATR